MRSEARITIKSVQSVDGQDEEIVEFSSDGMYNYENGRAEAVYYESEVTGLSGTKTVLKVSPDAVSVSHEGAVVSNMFFELGKRSTSVYSTPYGDADMVLDTLGITESMDETGGDAVVKYCISLNHAFTAVNKFCVHIEPLNWKN